MIKKLIRFIKRRYREIIIVAVVTFMLITLASSILYEKNGKSSKFFVDFFAPITTTLGTTTSNLTHNTDIIYSEEEKEILELEKENAKLREEIIKNKLKSEDLENLKKLENSLNFIDDKYDPIPISARIIAKNDGRFFTNFTITAGAKDGVKFDSIVINEMGLIGRVYEVSDNYSKVISIMDNKANVSFEIIEIPEERGILTQTINISDRETYINNMVNGYMFNINSNIQKGDTVITSGMGIYPKGIVIGKIVNIISDDQNLVKYVQVDPFVNFEDVDFVTILNPRETE